MKKSLLSLLLILCTAFSLCALVSCDRRSGSTAESDATTDDLASDATTVAETTVENDKWEALAQKVTTIAARDRQLKIECSVNKTGMKKSKNDIYLAGPDSVEEGVTPQIQQMVYERNKGANELLGTTI